MSVIMTTCTSREEWLNERKAIGGSDAACILGLNPWKSNVDLWLEKTGQKEPADLSDNPLVNYGAQAEAPLRKLFELDYPQLKVEYMENNLWMNEKYPWAHASLDGWITDRKGNKGILEIKTTNVSSASQKEEWNEKIPYHYYCQILHYLAVTEFDFAIVKAQLKWEIDGVVYCQVKHYRTDRRDVMEDIELLMAAEEKFAEDVLSRRKPALILPEI